MSITDYIATFALLISAYTFYWTCIRKSTGFLLVRLDSFSMSPDFVLLNTSNHDILVTRLDCAFLNSHDSGWYAPEHNYRKAFAISPDKSERIQIEFLEKDLDGRLAEKGKFKKNGSLELYHKDLKVIVTWLDHNGHEYESHAIICNYGMTIEGKISFCSPVVKKHDLFRSKIS